MTDGMDYTNLHPTPTLDRFPMSRDLDALSGHLASRDTWRCKLSARAEAGEKATARLADVKQAKDEALPYYQELIRIWDHAGPNLRAVIEADYIAGVSLMAKRWAEYDRAKAAELVMVDMGRAA